MPISTINVLQMIHAKNPLTFSDLCPACAAQMAKRVSLQSNNAFSDPRSLADISEPDSEGLLRNASE